MPRVPIFKNPMPSKSITMSEELWNKLDAIAINTGSTTSAVIRTVLTKHLCKMYSGKCSLPIDENLGDA